jgi:hypothetical protein
LENTAKVPADKGEQEGVQGVLSGV